MASWSLAKRDDKTVQWLYTDLIHTLREDTRDEEIEIIEDDPELTARKEAELTAKIFGMFPRETT